MLLADSDWTEDARRLHEAGYSRRAVHAKWVLDAYRVLHGHLTDSGEPLGESPGLDSSHYLTPDEWDEVRRAAQAIVDLAPLIANGLRDGRSE